MPKTIVSKENELYYQHDNAPTSTSAEEDPSIVIAAACGNTPKFNSYKLGNSGVTPAHANGRLYLSLLQQTDQLHAQTKLENATSTLVDPNTLFDIAPITISAKSLQEQEFFTKKSTTAQPPQEAQVMQAFGNEEIQLTGAQVKEYINSTTVFLPPDLPAIFYMKLAEIVRTIPREQLGLIEGSTRSIPMDNALLINAQVSPDNRHLFNDFHKLIADAKANPTKYGFQNQEHASAILGKSLSELGTMPAKVLKGKFFLNKDGQIDPDAPDLLMVNHAGLNWNASTNPKYLEQGKIKSDKRDELAEEIYRDILTELSSLRASGANMGSFVGAGLGEFLKTAPMTLDTKNEVIRLYANAYFDILSKENLGYEEVFIAPGPPDVKQIFTEVFNERLKTEPLPCSVAIHGYDALAIATEKAKAHPDKIVGFNNAGDAKNTLGSVMGENAENALPGSGIGGKAYAGDEHVIANSTFVLGSECISNAAVDPNKVFTWERGADGYISYRKAEIPATFPETELPKPFIQQHQEKAAEYDKQATLSLHALEHYIKNKTDGWGVRVKIGIAGTNYEGVRYPDVVAGHLKTIDAFKKGTLTAHDALTAIAKTAAEHKTPFSSSETNAYCSMIASGYNAGNNVIDSNYYFDKKFLEVSKGVVGYALSVQSSASTTQAYSSSSSSSSSASFAQSRAMHTSAQSEGLGASVAAWRPTAASSSSSSSWTAAQPTPLREQRQAGPTPSTSLWTAAVPTVPQNAETSSTAEKSEESGWKPGKPGGR